MVTASFISRLSQAVDQIEQRMQAEPSAEGRDGSLSALARTGMQRKIATSRPIPRIEARIS